MIENGKEEMKCFIRR